MIEIKRVPQVVKSLTENHNLPTVESELTREQARRILARAWDILVDVMEYPASNKIPETGSSGRWAERTIDDMCDGLIRDGYTPSDIFTVAMATIYTPSVSGLPYTVENRNGPISREKKIKKIEFSLTESKNIPI
jgi:hypothetical protein